MKAALMITGSSEEEGGAAEQPLEVNTAETVVIDYFVRVKVATSSKWLLS